MPAKFWDSYLEDARAALSLQKMPLQNRLAASAKDISLAQLARDVAKAINMTRKAVFITILASGSVLTCLAFFEVSVRLINPQPELYPRLVHSSRYGTLLPKSATIVQQLPGAWKFVYHTNEYGFRVSMPPISNRYDRPNIVLLGDSYTFGQGVNDGEEFGAVLADKLASKANVVNLGVPGFGLTHEIRVFYEFGRLFEPEVVVLQFCGNDPSDNLYEMVTTLVDGRFDFRTDRSLNSVLSSIKNWLSGSIIQKSAAYNLARNRIYDLWHRRVTESAKETHEQEKFYNELLVAFADDLRRRGIRLILIAVPGQLALFPEILKQVDTLNQQGDLDYLASEIWFDGKTDYGSPEGHLWGVRGHQIVAEHLVDPLRSAVERSVVEGRQTDALQ
ncbi:SGNH/GDSL hydrolase family protein [Bradyrhizobium sp. CCGUVB23]|uniref:SGNH/GDSL hydrolase family protein n=1 Tax=Bradyrhizobium sp. CCGUVB23 TaxID=2949630 RepID=UPI0020B311AE|nr:SGNH/GDSL hydrolase family protein [Bradyrhizobium sp. CCGUVB23]MCP3459248.1 SGNH/GDSL hydrolase family protein [Bradyrhizobium sp. CCGUVB23]